MLRMIFVWIALSLSAVAFGDQVKFHSGGVLDCQVVQESDQWLTVIQRQSLLRVPKSTITKIDRQSEQQVESSPAQADSASPVLPSWKQVVLRAGSQSWATDLSQIPATVIDVGVLKNVPYKSHRCGDIYEINVYGDPEAPAGVEIGVRNGALADEQSRRHCIDLACQLLGGDPKESPLRTLNHKQDLRTINGLTYEITPPTAEDAYGGWWVTVYDQEQLALVRASDDELKQITETKETVATRDERKHDPTKQTAPESEKPKSVQPADDELDSLERWSSNDLRYARATRANKPAPQATSSTGGRVYVRGYYRKDGTYVRPHTRSHPRR